jgi:UDP-2-acetamido-2,6-beta-L-arabino-hexul-4-ose reductase
MGLENVEITPLKVHEDHRGWVMEMLRSESVRTAVFGQIYVTTARPGISKGNHYHTRKTEWFCVLKGRGRLVLEDVHTHDRREIPMEEGRFVTVKIPSHVAHGVLNVGDEMLYLLAYIDEAYDPDDPDTHHYHIDYGTAP